MSRRSPEEPRVSKVSVVVIWAKAPVEGSVEVFHSELAGLAAKGGKVEGTEFRLTSAGDRRLEITIADAESAPGAPPARVTVRTAQPFTFFVRDVTVAFPVYIPQYAVAVTTAEDARTFEQIARDIRALGLLSEIEQIESEPEEDYDSAARRTRSLQCQTWLGLSRDIRIFEISPHREAGYWGWIRPRFHGPGVVVEESRNNAGLWYDFAVGRGAACEVDITRRLDEGRLPIVHGEQRDEGMLYRLTVFVTYERTRLAAETLRGTQFLVADGYGFGHTFTPEQQAEFEKLAAAELSRNEETVCHVRVEAVNTGRVPRYAWFRTPAPRWNTTCGYSHEEAGGFGVFETGRVYCVSSVDGKPLARSETSVLVQPGGKAVFEFAVPHRPIPRERARQLAQADFDARLTEVRAFWQAKLAAAAQLELPEKRVDEMAHAGLLHLDLVTYGREPNDTVTATIGHYSAIGSESGPIILFYECMGLHDLARRAIQFFLDKQRPDGSIQNYETYKIETAAFLYFYGEHYRFTRDREWLKKTAPQALKAAEYLIAWRGRSKREEQRGRGYGMIDGKVADPEDPYRYFINSGYACAALIRAAEWMREIDPARSESLAVEAEAFRSDIRAELAACIARSPVVSLGDGTWCPTVPPWAEATGALSLYAEGERCFTHESFVAQDSLIGPHWLMFQGIIDADDSLGDILLRSHATLSTVRNVALSQPYYSRHDWAHVARGEAKAFLKTYYNGFSGLADRETYTWWEHYHLVSPHKTHEEAWFLMQTRWMLILERGDTLYLLRAVPRAWMSNGKSVRFERMGSHFGPVSLAVESRLGDGVMTASYSLDAERRPGKLVLRLPHPAGLKARKAEGGAYVPEAEAVEVERPAAQGVVTLRF